LGDPDRSGRQRTLAVRLPAPKAGGDVPIPPPVWGKP
jgi:hypothetical protein